MFTEREFKLLSTLYKRKSMKSLALINGDYELEDFQTFALAYCFIRERMIISLDTGLGKTFVASALINLDTSLDNWLFVSKNSNLEQSYRKLNNLIRNKTVVKTTGQYSDIKSIINSKGNNKVIMMTYNCFESLEIQKYLFDNRDKFIGIIIDESHNIGNIGSNRSEMLKHMLRHCFKYQFMLTATPLSNDPVQIINQVNILDDTLIEDPEALVHKFKIWQNNTVIGYKDLEDLYEILEERYISITRKELGKRGDYKPQLHLLDVPAWYKKEHDVDTPDGIKQLKSYPDNPAIKDLKKILTEQLNQSHKGLIYANLEIYKTLIMDSCSEFRIALLDGSCSNAKKMQIQEQFNNNELDFLVCNLLEGVDLPCDFICFYELTVLTKQFIGRGERGLTGKDLDIYFIVLNKSYDTTNFYKNVYKRSLILETLCKKDVDEIKTIAKQLEMNLTGKDLDDYKILRKFINTDVEE